MLDLRGKVSTGNEQGLLGLTFSPDGTHLYIDFTDPTGDTHVQEFAMKGDVADVASRRELLFLKQPFANHNGGEVLTGPDGMLYIGLGDGGSGGDPMNNGQNKATLLGKILRINPKASATGPYSVPADNPFVSTAERPARDLAVGPAQPVAVLVRPRDRRSLDRRRRAERVRRDRLREGGSRRPQLRLEPARRDCTSTRATGRRARSTRCTSTRTPTAASR